MGGPVDTTAQVRAHFDVHLNRGCPSGFYGGLDSGTKKASWGHTGTTQ